LGQERGFIPGFGRPFFFKKIFLFKLWYWAFFTFWLQREDLFKGRDIRRVAIRKKVLTQGFYFGGLEGNLKGEGQRFNRRIL